MLDNLIASTAKGDGAAFEQLYNRTQKAVYYTAFSVTRNRSLAEDAMQTAYLNVVKNASRYVMGTNALAWILRITKNTALNLVKSRSRVEYVDPTDLAEKCESNKTESDESGLLVDLARQALDDDLFNILMLATVCGYKRREIADVLQMPVSTVSYKHKLALKTLRRVLQAKEDN